MVEKNYTKVMFLNINYKMGVLNVQRCKRSPKKDDLKSYGEIAQDKASDELADLLAKLNNDSK